MALNQEQIEKVKGVLLMSGWNDVMNPLYANRAREALKCLTLSPAERKKAPSQFSEFEDEGLRATIRECEWMLSVWNNEIVAYEHNRRLDEQSRQEPGPGMQTVPATPPQ